MKKILAGIVFALPLALASAPAFANHKGNPTPTAVPEIDASAGILVLAALAAVMLLVWERRRSARS